MAGPRSPEGAGGSATVQEMYEWVVADKQFTEEQQTVLRNDGKLTLISDRLHWARSYLKKIDVVENSSRGVWTITEKGRNITSDQIETELKAKRAIELKAKRAEIAAETSEREGAPENDENDENEIARTWRDELMARVLETTHPRALSG
ncbi:MAG: winged helix-turn-helix domain-containing protein [Acidimicrobiales bacterium]